MPKRSSRLDLNQLAKSIVDKATGNAPIEPAKPEKNKSAQELGRLGGKKGGNARAEKLTPERRSEIAKNAAQSRWKTKQDEDAKRMQAFPPVKKKHIGA